MASLLVKRVASSLYRVRTIASSSRLFSTKGYEFVQHDTKDECILKCDEILGRSSAAHGAVNGSPDMVNGNTTASIKMYAITEKPQAVYILVVLGDPETRNPYGGYAMEIFLDESLYNVYDMKTDFMDVNRKLFIPKKKVERTKAIGGNLMFYSEKKISKPAPWRPT